MSNRILVTFLFLTILFSCKKEEEKNFVLVNAPSFLEFDGKEIKLNEGVMYLDPVRSIYGSPYSGATINLTDGTYVEKTDSNGTYMAIKDTGEVYLSFSLGSPGKELANGTYSLLKESARDSTGVIIIDSIVGRNISIAGSIGGYYTPLNKRSYFTSGTIEFSGSKGNRRFTFNMVLDKTKVLSGTYDATLFEREWF